MRFSILAALGFVSLAMAGGPQGVKTKPKPGGVCVLLLCKFPELTQSIYRS